VQEHFDTLDQAVQVLVIDINEPMATTKWIQGYYQITVPCLNDQYGSTWSLYNQNGYIPLNHIILGDEAQTVYFWDNTMTKGGMIYRITLAVAMAVGEEPIEVIPFSFRTTTLSDEIAIRYSLPYGAEVQLTVYDISGKVAARLADGMKQSGSHAISWKPEADGIYFVRFSYERKTFTEKVVILK
jgi:hypothetical protein